jgi:hypothetical protein
MKEHCPKVDNLIKAIYSGQLKETLEELAIYLDCKQNGQGNCKECPHETRIGSVLS